MLAFLLAAALAGEPPEAAPVKPKDPATQAWLACMIMNARSLDDGISDAQTIAGAVAPACESYWRVVRGQMIKAQPSREQSAMFVATEGVDVRMALNVVLTVRKDTAAKAKAAAGADQAAPK